MDKPERAKDYKKGIKDKTKKRAEQNAGLRKDKRSEKLRQRRSVVPLAEGESFEKLLASYNKSALMEGNFEQLRLLNRILGAASKHQLEQHAQALLQNPSTGDPMVVHKLLAACRTDVIHPPAQQAIACLLNLTGTRTSFEYQLARTLVSAGFLQIVETHLNLFSSGKHPSFDSKTHGMLWETVVNIIITCPEARDAVLESSLMGYSQNAKMPTESAFTRELRHFFGDEDGVSPACDADRAYFIPLLLAVICAVFETNMNILPPMPFILTSWNYVRQAMYSMQLVPYQEMSELAQLQFSSITAVIFIILQGLKGGKQGEEDSVRLIGFAGQTMFMQTLARMYQFATIGNQVRIVRIFVLISALPMSDGVFQKAMEKADCIKLMMLSVQSNNPELRKFAYFWVGNYMADGAIYVQQLLQAGIMETLIPAIRRDTADIRRPAIYALLTMFSACDEDRRNNMGMSKVADGIMHTLVRQHGIFRWIVPFISGHGVGEESTVADILDVIARALQWNKAIALDALEKSDALGRIDVVLADVSKLKGSQSTIVYNAAVRVDNLINGRPPEQCRTEVMETEDDGGAFVPGTTIQQGYYNF